MRNMSPTFMPCFSGSDYIPFSGIDLYIHCHCHCCWWVFYCCARQTLFGMSLIIFVHLLFSNFLDIKSWWRCSRCDVHGRWFIVTRAFYCDYWWENNESNVHREFCLGIFVAKGDVGVGTIVGSAVFNIVCVIGICGLLVNTVGEECDRVEYDMRFTF